MDHSPVQWNEPATLGNLRDMAIRLDLRFEKIEARFDVLHSDLPTTICRDVWASAAATMALNLAALGLVVSILK
jgi:hypothetical protein